MSQVDYKLCELEVTRMIGRNLRKDGIEGQSGKVERPFCLIFKAASVELIYGSCEFFDGLRESCLLEEVGLNGVEGPIGGFAIIRRLGANL